MRCTGLLRRGRVLALCLFAVAAQAQPVVRSPVQSATATVAVTRGPTLAQPQAELQSRHAQVLRTLKELEEREASACKTNARAPACITARSERARQQGSLQSREQALRQHGSVSGSNCRGCHDSPSAAAARDPIVVVQPPMLPTTPPPTTRPQDTMSSRPHANRAADPMPTPSGDPRRQSCFIATAAWGTPWAPQVQVLRGFRDGVLLNSSFGRWVVDVYAVVSPPLAEAIAERPWARALTRAALTPVVWVVRWPSAAAALVLVAASGLVWAWHLRRRP